MGVPMHMPRYVGARCPGRCGDATRLGQNLCWYVFVRFVPLSMYVRRAWRYHREHYHCQKSFVEGHCNIISISISVSVSVSISILMPTYVPEAKIKGASGLQRRAYRGGHGVCIPPYYSIQAAVTTQFSSVSLPPSPRPIQTNYTHYSAPPADFEQTGRMRCAAPLRRAVQASAAGALATPAPGCYYYDDYYYYYYYYYY